MRETEVAVTFQPSGKTVHVLGGTRLLEAAVGAEIVLDQPCGGAGTCGKCRLVVASGASEPTEAEIDLLRAEELDAGVRLACQASVDGPATVEVPQDSLLASHHKILVDGSPLEPTSIDPAVRKRYVELPPPDRDDAVDDLTRLQRAIGPFHIGLELLREMPARLRATNFRGTAVLIDSDLIDAELIDFEPENTEAQIYAVAIDLGTTTLVGVLMNLSNAAEPGDNSDEIELDRNNLDEGNQLAVASRLNPQTRFGDDVLSRILHAQQLPQGLSELQESIVEGVDRMIGELAAMAAIGAEQIYEVTFSGNTTMQQLLCGIDPSALGGVPFVPAVGRGLLLPTTQLGLHVHPRATACLLPVIGGFVGGDTVSGILATGLAVSDGPTLLIDIGTNGEIVLFADGKLTAASTAAGPAFEGARILHGMRGTRGAIEKVVVDQQLHANVIGDVPPTGLCGSALIDVAAELLRHGLLTPAGRLCTADQLPDGTLPDLARRIVSHEGHPAFVLAWESETDTGGAVMLTQRDLRELQLATGAIRAGIAILLRRAGVDPADLKAVLLAGGFGNFIRRSNAQRIGLIPPEVPHPRIRYQGNTSLAGARMIAVSKQARIAAEELARRTEHLDLSRDPEFQTTFGDAMIFPA
ncbi:MAG: ASKHA domain-containing protein [Thermoguttaceae bacterium]